MKSRKLLVQNAETKRIIIQKFVMIVNEKLNKLVQNVADINLVVLMNIVMIAKMN